jgi:hypothetical protein
MWTKFGQMAGKAISKIKKPKGLNRKHRQLCLKLKFKLKKWQEKLKRSY